MLHPAYINVPQPIIGPAFLLPILAAFFCAILWRVKQHGGFITRRLKPVPVQTGQRRPTRQR